MERVTGIGGVFFKARNASLLREWYKRHLGIDVSEWGGTSFTHPSERSGAQPETTVWSIFDGDSRYFEPSSAAFMINYRVRDLDAVLAALRAEGCAVDERTDRSEYGYFGWVMDPEGNRIELWQPPG
jgi:predicted enzyme related to lactoylglutathione lyase